MTLIQWRRTWHREWNFILKFRCFNLITPSCWPIVIIFQESRIHWRLIYIKCIFLFTKVISVFLTCLEKSLLGQTWSKGLDALVLLSKDVTSAQNFLSNATSAFSLFFIWKTWLVILGAGSWTSLEILLNRYIRLISIR